MWGILVIALGALLAAIAYILNTPVSPETAEPFQLKIFNGITILALILGFLGSKVGLGERMELSRSLQETFMSPFVPQIEPQLVERTDTVFDGVPVRVYTPVTRRKGWLGGLVFFHGGGWIMGSIATHDGLAAFYSLNANIVVVSVGYRLAPEHVFPEPLDDCRKATEYFIRNAAQFDVDAARIAVGGDSAGGNLAAAVTLQLLRSGFTPRLKAQVLIYPVLQVVDFGLPSYFRMRRVVSTGPEQLVGIVRLYLNVSEDIGQLIAQNRHISPASRQEISRYMDVRGLPQGFVPADFKPLNPNEFDKRVTTTMEEKFMNPLVSPLLADDVSMVPETFVFTAGTDGLRDEGGLYVRRLRDVGVKVAWLDIPEAFHGCASTTEGILKTETGQRANNEIVEFLKETL